MIRPSKFAAWKAVIVLGGSLALLGYTMWSTNKAVRGVEDANADRIRATDESIQRAREFQVVSFEELRTRSTGNGASETPAERDDSVIGSIQSMLRQAQVHNFAQADDDGVQTLLRTASEFIYFRFVRNDPQNYIAWRLGRGDRFRDRDELYGKLQVALDYEELFGQTLSDETPIRDAFLKLYAYQESHWGDTYTPVGLAVDPASVMVVVLKINPIVGPQGVDLGDEASNRFWLETRQGTHRGWFTGAAHEELLGLNNMTSFQSGTVGFILEYSNGERRAVYLSCRRPTNGGGWLISSVASASRKNTGGMIEY